jgi:hypothetical protein
MLQWSPASVEEETQTPWRSVQAVYSVPFEASTASAGQKFARSVNSGAW